jgi:hypothetical protein
MTGHASPAVSLHDVVVVHEQSGQAWRPRRADIRAGRIIVTATPATSPPSGLLDRPAATYTIQAVDGSNRNRRFPHLTFARDDSSPPKEYVFD